MADWVFKSIDLAALTTDRVFPRSRLKLLDQPCQPGTRALSWASHRATWGALLARFGVVRLDLAAPDGHDCPNDLARPGFADRPGLSTLALGAMQRLAGSTWLLTNAPTTAPSTRLAKKNIDVQQDVLPRRCLLRSLCNVSFMPQI